MSAPTLTRFLGSARGPIARVSPTVRLMCGAFLFLAALLAPLPAPRGFTLLAGIVLFSLFLTGIPIRAAGIILGVLVTLHIPLALLILVGGQAWSGTASADPASVALTTFARSVGSSLISLAVVATFTLPELVAGIRGLPLPRALTAVAAQILHHTGVLIQETGSIAKVFAVRGAFGGIHAPLRVARSFPAAWLPRLAFKAERFAGAATIRGFDPGDARLPRQAWTRRDIAMAGISVVVLFLSIAVRSGWLR